MNVLLISFSFPPAGGVGVLRALSLAKYLPQNGVRVDVLTARNAPTVGRDASLLQQVPAGVTIHQTWTPDLPFAWRKRIKQILTRERKSISTPSVNSSGVQRNGSSAVQRPAHLNPLRTLVGNLLLPDPQVGWLPFALRAAKRIIRARQIDAVVITAPPFSSVRLTTLLRRVYPVLPIVVDFRDEWLTTTIGLVSFNKNARARKVAQATESAAVRDATAVVAVTEAAVAELCKRYPEQTIKFQCIPNGFDGPLLPPSTVSDVATPPVILTYMGTIYGSTDPGSFVQAVREMPRETRANLRIRFIGHIETAEHREMLLSLGDTVELVGFLPQAEALRALERSHFLLLITHDPINVSAKFYDYLGSGKPILAAIHPEGDVRRILERARAGCWADIGDSAGIRTMLVQAVDEMQSGITLNQSPNVAVVQSFHRRPLTQQYALLLKTLAGVAA